MFRSSMGPRIMQQIRNCMTLFRSPLGDVPASVRPQIMELARKCALLTASKSKYSNSPTLRSWPTWVLYLSGHQKALGDSPEKLVSDLLKDNLFLIYVVAEILYDVYMHVNLGEAHRDVVELQHVISYITTPSLLNTKMFRPSTTQQASDEVLNCLIQILEFFVRESPVMASGIWVPGKLQAFMRDTPIDIFASLKTTFWGVTKCRKCNDEYRGLEQNSYVTIIGFGNLTVPTKFSKILADESVEDLTEKGKPNRR